MTRKPLISADQTGLALRELTVKSSYPLGHREERFCDVTNEKLHDRPAFLSSTVTPSSARVSATYHFYNRSLHAVQNIC